MKDPLAINCAKCHAPKGVKCTRVTADGPTESLSPSRSHSVRLQWAPYTNDDDDVGDQERAGTTLEVVQGRPDASSAKIEALKVKLNQDREAQVDYVHRGLSLAWHAMTCGKNPVEWNDALHRLAEMIVDGDFLK